MASTLAFSNHPAIDSHGHPLLSEQNRNVFPLEGIISGARIDTHDSHYTVAGYRAITELSKLLGLNGSDPTWEALRNRRDNTDYVDLCKMCFKTSEIQCILLDDGLDGVADLAGSSEWHDQFTVSPCRRIVRIEAQAENILRDLLDDDPTQVSTSIVSTLDILEGLVHRFKASILAHAQDERVAGFKSVVCYRTGLDIAPSATIEEIQNAVQGLILQYRTMQSLRIQQKVLNDYLVCIVLEIASQYRKPVQFDTGFGDGDFRLTKSSPTHMQPIIEVYPNTPIVLHSGYPYTRDAGYMASVYKNVYLDLGAVFSLSSRDGEVEVINHALELAPTNKILWSTDGRWWPESYQLSSSHSRMALAEALRQRVHVNDLTQRQAIEIAQNVLFNNANRLYNLGLTPTIREFKVES